MSRALSQRLRLGWYLSTRRSILASFSAWANRRGLRILRGSGGGCRPLVLGSIRRTRTTGTGRERIVAPGCWATGAARTVGTAGHVGTTRTTRREALARREPSRRGRIRHVAKVGTWTWARAGCSTTTPVSRRGASVEVVWWVRVLAKGSGSWGGILCWWLSTRASASLEQLVSTLLRIETQDKIA